MSDKQLEQIAKILRNGYEVIRHNVDGDKRIAKEILDICQPQWIPGNKKGIIEKFGVITEDAEGRLLLQGFSIQGEHRFSDLRVAALTLIKERLEQEIVSLNKQLRTPHE